VKIPAIAPIPKTVLLKSKVTIGRPVCCELPDDLFTGLLIDLSGVGEFVTATTQYL